MTMHYMIIFCVLIAVVYVVVKLLLEHQESEDKAKGINQPHEAYTVRGMFRLIREEQRLKKENRRAMRRTSDTDRTISVISVRPFQEPSASDAENDSDTDIDPSGR